ncbi:MAG TPA: hypothetical protein VGN88_11415 [Phycisphaerae bacterium]
MPLSFALRFPFFSRFGEAFKISLVLQLFILFLSAIVLDGGQLNQFMLLSATAYWCTVAIVMFRRNGNATRFDQFLLQWGYPLMIALTALVSACVPMGLLRHP